MEWLDVVEIAGALCILSAFAANQARRLDSHSAPYLLLNAVGAGTLAVLAALDRSWGFLLLEGVWAVVAAVSLARGRVRRGAGRPPA